MRGPLTRMSASKGEGGGELLENREFAHWLLFARGRLASLPVEFLHANQVEVRIGKFKKIKFKYWYPAFFLWWRSTSKLPSADRGWPMGGLRNMNILWIP